MSPARRLAVHSAQAAFVLAVAALWLWATRPGGGVHPFLLPPPDAVGKAFYQLVASGAFWAPLGVTAFTHLTSFLSAAVVGLAVGFAVSRSPLSISVFDPLFAAAYSVPAVLLLPLFMLVFGVGMGSKIALGFLVSFFPIAMSTIVGFRSVERSLVLAARSMGASSRQLFFEVLLPAGMPMVLSGLRIAMITSLLSILGAEAIASLAGLGHEIVQRVEYLDTAQMYALVFITLIFAFLINGVALFIDAWGRRRFS